MNDIERDEGAITQRAVPGPALYQVSAIPRGDALKAMVGIVPGYADHAARYGHVMDAWAERGIGSVAIDLRGHGRATGARGFVSRFDEYFDDVAELARIVADKARGAPTFLMGHSMGGLVSALSVIDQRRSWRGLLLSSPYFGLAMDVPKSKAFAGKIAARIIPKLSIATGIRGLDVTHDERRARAYEEDPLVFKNARARWFTEAIEAQVKVLARAKEITLPLYVVFGDEDPIAKLAAARTFFEAVGSPDKTFDERKGLRHETLNEIEWRPVADAMSDWILKHA